MNCVVVKRADVEIKAHEQKMLNRYDRIILIELSANYVGEYRKAQSRVIKVLTDLHSYDETLGFIGIDMVQLTPTPFNDITIFSDELDDYITARKLITSKTRDGWDLINNEMLTDKQIRNYKVKQGA